jgi:MYXO-CTERM domain-containing protein
MNLQKIISLAALTASFALVGPSAGLAETTGWEDTDGWETGIDPSVIYFVSPAPDTYYPEAPASFDAELAVIQSEFDPISDVELFVDGVSAGIQECSAGCSFPVVLDQGEHVLLAVALSSGEASDSILVWVGSEPPSETGGDTGESGGESDEDTGDTWVPADEEESGGSLEGEDTGDGEEVGDTGDAGASDDMLARGCSVDGTPSHWALLALPMLLLIPAVRRRD